MMISTYIFKVYLHNLSFSRPIVNTFSQKVKHQFLFLRNSDTFSNKNISSSVNNLFEYQFRIPVSKRIKWKKYTHNKQTSEIFYRPKNVRWNIVHLLYTTRSHRDEKISPLFKKKLLQLDKYIWTMFIFHQILRVEIFFSENIL